MLAVPKEAIVGEVCRSWMQNLCRGGKEGDCHALGILRPNVWQTLKAIVPRLLSLRRTVSVSPEGGELSSRYFQSVSLKRSPCSLVFPRVSFRLDHRCRTTDSTQLNNIEALKAHGIRYEDWYLEIRIEAR
jgi:hypothetical protein